MAFDECPNREPELYPAGPGRKAACLLVEPARVQAGTDNGMSATDDDATGGVTSSAATT